MERIKIASIPGLIILALTFTTLPLIVALLAATLYVDVVNTKGQQAIYNATVSAEARQELEESLTAMERNARQYGVLGDPQILQVYLEQRRNFLGSLLQLRSISPATGFQIQLDKLQQLQTRMHQRILAQPPGTPLGPELLDDFDAMGTLFSKIQQKGDALTRQATAQMQSAAGHAEQFLTALSLAVVPFVLLIAAYFIVQIVRPIRELDHAIHRLGEGEFEHPVQVNGPRDLRDLGRRLEWMRRRLLDLESQKTQFLRHMSHELKTPLASIREGSELLAEEVLGGLNASQREVASLLRQNGLRLQRHIENLLQFSITQSQDLELDIKSLELDRQIRWVLHQHRLPLRSKRIDLVLQSPSLVIEADREKLRTIIDNLISNAVKYSPPGGKLWVQVSHDHEFALLEVRDEGPGIPLQERDKVFDAFYQTSIQYQDGIKGTGLGLSIARAYVRLHGGTIQVGECTQGARLQVFLPIHHPTQINQEASHV